MNKPEDALRLLAQLARAYSVVESELPSLAIVVLQEQDGVSQTDDPLDPATTTSLDHHLGLVAVS